MSTKEFNPRIEFLAGLFVLLGIGALIYLAVIVAGNKFGFADTYTLQARFKNVGGLNVGSSVLISGVPVGQVKSIDLDGERFDAIVTFTLPAGVELADDTIASIKTTGLIGDKYLSLLPGGSDFTLEPGDIIIDTESAVSIEDLLSRFAFGEVN